MRKRNIEFAVRKVAKCDNNCLEIPAVQAVYNLRTENEIGLAANYCYVAREILPLLLHTSNNNII